jgi:carbamoyl-phosphate synthase large subunit
MNNILILSAGRRVALVAAFKAELAKRELGYKVLTTDLKPELSAACQIADSSFQAPPVTDSGYIQYLYTLCKQEGIRLVIPTIDTELSLLSKHRDIFESENVHIIISDTDIVQSCRDKRLTAELFKQLHINTPHIYNLDSIKFPCFAKPYDGSCSVGAEFIKDKESLRDSLLQNTKMMFMEFIDQTHTEFTIDIYYDRHGKLKCLVPRKRIEVRGGEVSKSITQRHHLYNYLLPKLEKLTGVRGCITLQVFVNQAMEKMSAIEINPRFGGGYPLSYNAGANYPGWLIDEYILNKEIPFFDNWESDLLMLRYDAQIFIHNAR